MAKEKKVSKEKGKKTEFANFNDPPNPENIPLDKRLSTL